MPVSWWPPQPGWWILLAAVLAFAALGCLRVLRAYRANGYRRAALRELQALERLEAADIALPLASLLKRVALTAYARSAVAGLTGTAWASFLDPKPVAWLPALRRAALDPRAPLSAEEVRAALAAARLWIKHHRRDTAA
jgi:hypothetical protein